jgi:hypothetical protein
MNALEYWLATSLKFDVSRVGGNFPAQKEPYAYILSL